MVLLRDVTGYRDTEALNFSCSKICRLCGIVCESNINLFGEENAELKLWIKLQTMVAIVVLKDDPLPKGVCKTCYEKLELFSKFQEECRETQNKFNEFLQFQSIISESNTHSVINVQCEDIQNFKVKEFSSNVREDIRNELQNTNPSREEFNTQSMEVHDSAKIINTISEIECSKSASTKNVSGVNSVARLNSQKTKNKNEVTKYISILKNNSTSIRSNTTESSILEPQSIICDNIISRSSEENLNEESKILSNDAGLTKYIVSRIITSPYSESVPENQQRLLLIPLVSTNGNVPIPKLPRLQNTCPNLRIPIQHNMGDNYRTPLTNKSKNIKKKNPRKNRSRSNVRGPGSVYVKKHVERISCSKFRCKLCNETFRWNYQCEYHVHNHTREKAFVCKDCGKNFSAMHLLKLHMACHVKGYSHLCKVCAKEFQSSTDLKDHERMHLDIKPPQSIICDNVISRSTVGNLNDDSKIPSNDPELTKYIVSRIITSPYSGSVQENQQRVLLIPLVSTNGKVPIPKLPRLQNTCPYPRIPIQHNIGDNTRTPLTNKSKNVKKKNPRKNRSRSNVRVPSSVYVKKHVERISCSQFRCKLCNETFRWNYQCEYHVRNHTGEKAFVCKDCGKNFSAMYLLKLHMACHVKGYSHLCKVCGKGFRSSTGLKDHERMHLDIEPPYKCSDCGKGFYYFQSYSYHKMNHIKQLNYMCEQCGKKFQHMKHLNQHIFRHSGIKSHNCTLCGKSFSRKYNLVQHMNRHKGKNSCRNMCNDKSSPIVHKDVL